MESLRNTWKNKPLIVILGLALLIRLVSVIWAKGFGMHDDHFLIIEPAQAWANGSDYNNWLPNDEGTNSPSGHSFFYVGLHYLLFRFLAFLRITDPEIKMLIIRGLHALLSLVTIWIGFLFVRRYASLRNARLAGILLAIFWFMPWLSVRNLVEVVVIPFLMLGTYLSVKADEEDKPWQWFLLSGLILGIGFSIRYQSIVFSAGLFLALWIHKRWFGGLAAGLGYLLAVAILQGIPDILVWGKPFVELQEYVRYNMTHAGDYITSPWYTYLLLIAGILIPPISIFLFAGMIASWRKHILVFLPVILFLIFHSIFPNKQERFILPIVPFIIVAGIAGWELFGEKWKVICEGRKIRSLWIFFWVINLLLLPLISSMYSKKARVESMLYLSKYENIRTIVIDERPRYGIKFPPTFYLGQWVNVIERDKAIDLDALQEKLSFFEPEDFPRFVLFFDEQDLSDRVIEMQSLLPDLTFEARMRPGIIDAFLNWVNPNNANQSIFIYRNTQFIPESIQTEMDK